MHPSYTLVSTETVNITLDNGLIITTIIFYSVPGLTELYALYDRYRLKPT
jgi:hypothetical protein